MGKEQNKMTTNHQTTTKHDLTKAVPRNITKHITSFTRFTQHADCGPVLLSASSFYTSHSAGHRCTQLPDFQSCRKEGEGQKSGREHRQTQTEHNKRVTGSLAEGQKECQLMSLKHSTLVLLNCTLAGDFSVNSLQLVSQFEPSQLTFISNILAIMD